MTYIESYMHLITLVNNFIYVFDHMNSYQNQYMNNSLQDVTAMIIPEPAVLPFNLYMIQQYEYNTSISMYKSYFEFRHLFHLANL